MFQGKVGLREAVKRGKQGDCPRQRPVELQFSGIREYARTQIRSLYERQRKAGQESVLAAMQIVTSNSVEGGKFY